jgi:hypothetical protein
MTVALYVGALLVIVLLLALIIVIAWMGVAVPREHTRLRRQSEVEPEIELPRTGPAVVYAIFSGLLLAADAFGGLGVMQSLWLQSPKSSRPPIGVGGGLLIAGTVLGPMVLLFDLLHQAIELVDRGPRLAHIWTDGNRVCAPAIPVSASGTLHRRLCLTHRHRVQRAL